MKIIVSDTKHQLGHHAANHGAELIRRAIKKNGKANIIVATGASQFEMLANLVGASDIAWDKVTAFHLDEYVGLSARHAASFRRFLRERLFDHVPVRAFHGLDGEAKDPELECARYAALLRAESPALAILGVGENGHLAFIDPPECDFADSRDARVVTLDEACRTQQVHDGAFARVEDVPRTALSLTIPFLMRIPEVVAVVPGPKKRAAVRAALDGPLTCACPASILRRHPRGTLFLDEASAAEVGGRSG